MLQTEGGERETSAFNYKHIIHTHLSNAATLILSLQLDAELTQGRQSRWKHFHPLILSTLLFPHLVSSSI